MTTTCPDLDDLARADGHRSECATCAALFELQLRCIRGEPDASDGCDEVMELLPLLGQGDLDDADHERVLDHVADCDRCLQIAAALEIGEHGSVAPTANAVTAAPAWPIEPPVRSPSRARRYVAGAAAGAAAIAMAAAIALWLRPGASVSTAPSGVPGDRTAQPPTVSVYEPLTIVVLVQGDELWMGNETYISNTGERLNGGYTGVKKALDGLAAVARDSDRGALVTYAGGRSNYRRGFRSLRTMSGDALGPQSTYNEAGVPLVAGVTAAGDMLDGEHGRRVLVVIGDGGGEHEDISRLAAPALAELRRLQVESYFIEFNTAPWDSPASERNQQLIGYSGVLDSASAAEIPRVLERLMNQLGRTRGR